LSLENVPPIPAGMASAVGRYTEFKPTAFADWHPVRKEMLVSRRHQNTSQIYRLTAPGAAMELLTDYPEPVRSASYQPTRGDSWLFPKDTGGNEVYRVYQATAAGSAEPVPAVPITAADRRVQDMKWSTRGDRIMYVTVPVKRAGSNDTVQSEVRVADPRKLATAPEDSRLLGSLPGGGWLGFVWAPDDRQLAFIEYVSINQSHIWLMDVADGNRRRLTGADDAMPVSYARLQFSRDGKGLYAVTDRGAEFKRLVYIDLKTRKHTVLTANLSWDVEDFDLSHDGKLLALVTNEDGADVLHVMHTSGRKTLATPSLPVGTLGGLRWHRNNDDLAITVSSARAPADIYSFSVKTAKLTRWTRHEPAGADPASFVEPELVRWKSFDGLTVSGFLYRAPPAQFPGKRPVLINIHGGPEAQYKPGFGGRNNYLTSEMGISVIWPNVRGSNGYGKSFLKLDNGRLRENSVKDIKALLDWIPTQPDLDAGRVMVQGGSYGGYMSLAVASLYAEQIAGAIDIVGISNFVTFLERTESYRRDLRRAEYGDERDPDMRRFLESISPLNRADRILKPLFVVQGKNDPRVPVTEAEQMVANLKGRGTPVWYMLAADEGHGFAKKANADYQFFATIEFVRKYLLESAR
jgi:dipeptidyl aminopeptidase/acylaminoacyl peptidase